VLGAIFAARLAVHLRAMLPAGAAIPGGVTGAGMNPAVLATMPADVRYAYAQAFTASLATVFLVAAAIALLGFALTWLLPERPLRQTVAAAASDVGRDAGDAFPMPRPTNPVPELLRGLSRIADRDVQRAYIESIVARAGVTLGAAAAWLLVRLERDPSADSQALGRAAHVPAAVVDDALRELRERDLVRERRVNGGAPRREITASGYATLARLVDARRARLTELCGDWRVEGDEALAGALREIARGLVPDGATTAAPASGR
jgi:hypothetical protein